MTLQSVRRRFLVASADGALRVEGLQGLQRVAALFSSQVQMEGLGFSV